MAYHCTDMGNPRCLRIAQSWEKLDGLSLHNSGKPQMIAQSLETPETSDDCTIHLLHIVIEIKVPVWTCSKDSKADLIQKLCMTLLSLAIPPFRGDGQMTKKCPKFIYELREEISYPPGFCPFLGGYCPFGGDIGPFCHP